MKHLKHILEFACFLLGIALFILVIKSVELGPLKNIFLSLHGLGWLVFVLYPFMCAWDVAAWKAVFSKRWHPQIKFWDLFTIRLAGEAVNNITPVIDVGGEPLKVVLVSNRFEIPKKSALAAGIIGRTALFLAEIYFVVLGLALSFFILPLPWEWKWALFITVLVFIILIALFIFAQKKGLFVTFIEWLDYLQFDPKLFERFHIPFKQIDEEISSFYSTEEKGFKKAVFLHTLGWISGGVEMFFIFQIIGSPVSFVQAMMLESLLQLVRLASFFIPGNLGAQEGGLAFFVQLMGAHPAYGVAASLLKRARQILWTGIGFAIWGLYQLLWLKDSQENVENSSF